ncbi:hypothetical protein Tco_0904104 [Tanacetum coccineum]
MGSESVEASSNILSRRNPSETNRTKDSTSGFLHKTRSRRDMRIYLREVLENARIMIRCVNALLACRTCQIFRIQERLRVPKWLCYVNSSVRYMTTHGWWLIPRLDINALALSDRHPTYHETPSDRVIMDDPNITMEEYIRLEEEKARRRGKL